MQTNYISTSPPYSVAVTYRNDRRLYNIPVDFNINELILSLKRVFVIEEGYAVHLYLKKCRKLLNGFVRLSQLVAESSMLTQVKSKDSKSASGTWNQIMKSHQFRPHDIVTCKTFIELTMEAVEFAG